MEVKTGLTEYQGRIGLVGKEIIDNAYYGEVKPFPNEYIPNS